MGRKTLAVMLGAMAATLALQAAAQTNVYRWTDKDGKVHFGDTPPPDDASNVTQKRMGGSGGDAGALPYDTQVAMKRNPVSIYVADNCAPCDAARQLLSRRGIPYTERNAQGNREEAEAVKKLTGATEVPVLLVGDRSVKGWDESAWSAALDAGGYPKAMLPGRRAPEPTRVGGPTKPPESQASPGNDTPPGDAPPR
jgi:glutaredoxin